MSYHQNLQRFKQLSSKCEIFCNVVVVSKAHSTYKCVSMYPELQGYHDNYMYNLSPIYPPLIPSCLPLWSPLHNVCPFQTLTTVFPQGLLSDTSFVFPSFLDTLLQISLSKSIFTKFFIPSFIYFPQTVASDEEGFWSQSWFLPPLPFPRALYFQSKRQYTLKSQVLPDNFPCCGHLHRHLGKLRVFPKAFPTHHNNPAYSQLQDFPQINILILVPN